MLLKTRLIISSVIGYLLLASALITNEIHNQEKILKTLQYDTLDSLQELWEEITSNDSEQLSREAELISKNIYLIPELKTGNQQKIDTKLINILGTKFKSNPLHWIAIFNHQGSLIYFSENLRLTNNFIPSTIISGFFKNHPHSPSGIAESLTQHQSIIGGHFISKANKPAFLVLSGFYIEHPIKEMSTASNDTVLLFDAKGKIIYQISDIKNHHLDPKTFLMKKVFELKKIDQETYHIYSWPLKLNNHNFFAQLLLLSNGSVFHSQIKSSLYTSIILGIFITLLITFSLSYILTRAMSPLDFVIRILNALIKGDTDVKMITYKKDDEIGSVIHAAESLRKKTIEVQNLEVQKKDLIKIREQLNIARSIQSSIVTGQPLNYPTFQVAGFMRAATEVGGDFYDYFKTEDNKLILMIGDVSGKGVPAAIFMSMTISYLKAHLKANLSISESLEKTNNLLIEKNNYQFFVTVFVCVIDLKNNVMTYSNAGHNPPLINTKKSAVEFLKMTGDMALGVIANVDYKEKTHKLYPGESLLLYTDGLTEAVNIRQEQYGEERLTTFFKSGQYLTPATHLEYIIHDIDLFSDSMDQFDDMTGVIFAIELDSPLDISLTLSMHMNDSLQNLSAFIKKHATFFEPFESKIAHIEIALEELIVNTIKYGANEVKYKNELIYLNFKCYKKNKLIITLIDKVKAFNPLERRKPDLDEHLANRKVGGLGIHLARELSEDFNYTYENSMNKTTLVFSK